MCIRDRSSAAPSYQIYDNPVDPYATPGSGWLGTAGNVAQGAGYGYSPYQAARSINAVRSGAMPAAQFSSKVLGGTLGKAFLPLGVALEAGGAGYAAVKLNRGFNQSQFNTGNGLQVGNRLKYGFGTTEGKNKLADVANKGGLALTGAGIGAMVGGPVGAAIGLGVGGLAQLGMSGYRSATGWDSNKYNAAKDMYTKNMGMDDAVGMVGSALSDKGGGNMFETKKMFGGKRDLGEEAYQDSIKR
jgi:hypothetical protein